jgi:hypothetical protein
MRVVMMPSPSEKRQQQRIARQEALAYTIFSILHWAEVDTLSLNLSADGLGFIARKPLSPRTIVCIRSTPAGNLPGPEHGGIQIPQRVLAEVKWCRERLTQDGFEFEIGAAYLLR